MKFGMATHIGPYRGLTVKISNFWKFKMAAAAILKITNSRYLHNGLTDLSKFGKVVQNVVHNRPDR